jgi:hypothetical protein
MIWTHWCHAGMAPHDAGFGEDQPLPTARWGLVYLGGQQCHGYGALMAHGAATCRIVGKSAVEGAFLERRLGHLHINACAVGPARASRSGQYGSPFLARGVVSRQQQSSQQQR